MKHFVLKTLSCAILVAAGAGSMGFAADQAADEAAIRANAEKYVEAYNRL